MEMDGKLQPPSGGCVLKHRNPRQTNRSSVAATFGWLCVETVLFFSLEMGNFQAATFGWLCVETPFADDKNAKALRQPPSGGCVLKLAYEAVKRELREAATFGWLCVETSIRGS